MPFDEFPAVAAWQHRDARVGFESAFFQRTDDGWRLTGVTSAVEAGQVWAVEYDIVVDAGWRTRRATVSNQSSSGRRTVRIEADGQGRWWVDGEAAPHLDGCLDLDLESSAMTNTLPVHRMPATPHSAPAAYVRALDLAVHRLEQTYQRLPDDESRAVYEYTAPEFGFNCRLVYDASGLLLDYPGIAVRSR